ncbi:hypothetical protein ACVW0I_007744 [Bradyrhizobium sp. LM6.11]
MRGMRITMQHGRELMQLRVAKAFGLNGFHRRGHVVAVGAGLAVALEHVAMLVGERQPTGILHVAAVDDIGERGDALPRVVLQPHRAHDFAIDRRHLLARAQIGDHIDAVLRGNTEGDAAAGAAAVEPKHQTRLFGRTTVHEGIDAERAMLADQPRRDAFLEFEARPPY